VRAVVQPVNGGCHVRGTGTGTGVSVGVGVGGDLLVGVVVSSCFVSPGLACSSIYGD
jgi:hypothetical protein